VTIVDEERVEAAISDATRDSSDDIRESIEIRSAFRVHKWSYDPSNRHFFYVGDKFKLHSDAGARVGMLEERLNWLCGVYSRNPYFRTPLPGVNRDSIQLNRVDELPAIIAAVSKGRSSKEIHLVGMLTQPEEGVWCIEDGTRSVSLLLEPGIKLSRGYFTETCVVHGTGVYDPEAVVGASLRLMGSSWVDPDRQSLHPAPPHSTSSTPSTSISLSNRAITEGRLPGAFRVKALSHPPVESRASTLLHMCEVDTFRKLGTPGDFERVLQSELSPTSSTSMFMILSDLHMDDPSVQTNLVKVMTGFASYGQIPSLCVLMGNFTSRPHSTAGAVGPLFTAAMRSLADILVSFPSFKASQFLLIPGPGDPGSAGGVLPRPPLPTALAQPLLKLKNSGWRIALGSNPTRLRFFTQELVFFRGEVSQRLARGSMLPPQAGSDSHAPLASTTGSHVTFTLLRQCHLLPLSSRSQPIYWELDHTLRLSPAPHAIFVGEDARYWAQEEVVSGSGGGGRTIVACPGSFCGDETFCVYRPTLGKVELCDVNGDDEEEEGGEAMEPEFCSQDQPSMSQQLGQLGELGLGGSPPHKDGKMGDGQGEEENIE